MTIRERISGLFQRKAMPSRLWEAILWGRGMEDFTRWDKRKLIEQGYERNPAFYAASNLVAQTVASIPIEVEYRSQGQKLVSEDHPILHLLERDVSRQEFVTRTMLYWIVCGEAYAQILFSEHDRRPLGLVAVPSQYMNPVQGDYRQPIIGYKYREREELYFPKEEVIQWTFPNLREYFHGMSAGVPLGEALDLNNGAITWNKNIAISGGVPPLVAKGAGITKEQAEQIKDAWQLDGGANKSHRLRVVSENLTFERINTSPHDAEWKEATLQTMRMIFMGLGVSSELMNDAANKTYSNYQEARKALYLETCIPLARRFYSTLSRCLRGYYGDAPSIRVNVDGIDAIQEDRQLAVNRLTAAVSQGILTPNEARQELGYPRLGDTFADQIKTRNALSDHK